MTEENFRYMEHFFLSTLFLVIFINLDLKQHGDIIQLDFKGQIGWFFTLGNFFFKNHGEKLKKWKNVPKAPKMTKSEIFWIPGMVCYWFYQTSPSKRPKMWFFTFFGHFLGFGVYPLRGSIHFVETHWNPLFLPPPTSWGLKLSF